MLPPDLGGPGLGPRTFAAVAATLAEADASVAMVYLMHILGVATIRSARPSAAKGVTPLLQEVVAGRHLSTLAFSEQIGRASCRERVKISVVARARKKKETRPHDER